MNPTASWYLLALSKTLQEEILPALSDAQVRAAASSMLQILAYLERNVSWSAKPLAARLAARLDSLADLSEGTYWKQRYGDPSRLSTEELEYAIENCDAHVQEMISAAGPSFASLAYCCEAARIDLQFMRPSHLGKLTRKHSADSTT
jgi:hypothetical protein